MGPPPILVAGYLSIDTVTTPAGRRDGVPGGAALYMALGARRAGTAARLAATAGDDWPASWLDALAALGVDVSAVARGAGPSRRARLDHAASGARRSEADASWWDRTHALAPAVPGSLDGLAALAAAPMPAGVLAAFVDAASAAGVPVVADTSEAFAARDGAALLGLLPRLSVFAPSREETRILLPGLDDDSAALALAARGPVVVQKRGAEGAVVADAGGRLDRLPAPPATVVDPTGAGDATVGAIAAGIARGVPVLRAAREALDVGALAVSGPGAVPLGLAVPAAGAATCRGAA